jgi:DNA-binding NtrC family response regulator
MKSSRGGSWRKRRAEIGPIAERHVKAFAAQLGSAAPTLGEDALDVLRRHEWPGNVRELKNVIERAVLLAGCGPIRPEHLQLGTLRDPRETDVLPAVPKDLRSEVEDVEREKILSVLESCGGNQRQAAKLLGISRTTLLARLDRYGVPRPRKRPD